MKRFYLIILFLFISPLWASEGVVKDKWNFLVYVASNNNLYRFGPLNVDEMKRVGSNERVNIFVQIDQFGKKEVTRYHIKKGEKIKISKCDQQPICLSGTKENLFDFASEIIKK